MIDGQNLFNQPVKDDQKTYDNIKKITAGPRNDYAIQCLLEYVYFKNCFKIIARDLSTLQVLDADPKQYNKLMSLVIQKIMRQCILLLKKPKKIFWVFRKDQLNSCKFNVSSYNQYKMTQYDT